MLRRVLIAAILPALLHSAAANAATYAVGAGQPYPKLAGLPALKPGDIVEIHPGTYNEVKRWVDSGTPSSPIIVRGVGTPRPVIDAKGLTVDGAMPNPRAVFQIEGGNITVENLELVNARNGDNGAGIRVSGKAAVNVVIRSCKITGCDMGVMSDSNDNLLIESTEIASNGTPSYDGYSHNLYLGGGKSTLRFCYIHDAPNGQNVKSRGHYTELLYNWIADSQDGEVGLVDAAETTTPNSNAVLIGNVIVSKPRLDGYNTGRFIQFGQDSGGAHTGKLHAINNTFVAGDGRVTFLAANATGASIVAVNNIFFGSDKIASSGGWLSGSNNWLPAGASAAGLTSSVQSASPGFVNAASRDFHLTAGSGCRDVANGAPTYLDGAGTTASGVPAFHYVAPLQAAPRPTDGKLDLGAYELGGTVKADGGGAASDGRSAVEAGGGRDLGDGSAVPSDAVAGERGDQASDGCGCAVGRAPDLVTLLALLAAPIFRLVRRRRPQKTL